MSRKQKAISNFIYDDPFASFENLAPEPENNGHFSQNEKGSFSREQIDLYDGRETPSKEIWKKYHEDQEREKRRKRREERQQG